MTVGNGRRSSNAWYRKLLPLLAVAQAKAFLDTAVTSFRDTRLPPAAAFPTTALLCQLLGMNCARPTDFTFSFQGFCQRGGNTDIHVDGWGLAFYQGNGLRAIHDVEAASKSALARFLSNDYPIQTLNMISHIRYATQGSVDLANVHPFQREMWGIQWCFAHNGDVPLFAKERQAKSPTWLGDVPGEPMYHPVGDTDSEAVFCALLNALRAKFTTLPSLPVLHDYLHTLCQEIVDHNSQGTILNFLLTCGPQIQFAYSWPGARPGSNVWNGLHYIVREPPFERCRLRDLDYEVDFSEITSEEDRVAVIATKPLTLKEVWTEVQRGELILFDEGIPHKAAEECSIRLCGWGHLAVMQAVL